MASEPFQGMLAFSFYELGVGLTIVAHSGTLLRTTSERVRDVDKTKTAVFVLYISEREKLV